MLYIVATPIGNLKDITLRALETLQAVDAIICEDTRRTSLLLNHYQLKKPLISMNDYNEIKILNSLVERLKSGENLALVSDAGTPLISDPGYKLVRACLETGIEVDSIPGPSSVITALTLSGLPPDKFLFLGYLPEKPGHRKDTLQKIDILNQKMPQTFIIFVAPHKLIGTLREMKENFGDIEIVLAHELTKIHQSIKKKKISVWLENLNPPAGGPKGEYVLLFRLNP
ncbi:MAG: Ribosomal RNA small subunit methyltransferase I [Microgenomates group bacterium Gr01-1014_7]|nr:MAG: Ribosomal RNA small subunit methyltransferase I [Microgenomates group bacterium Gr01-1014_7]